MRSSDFLRLLLIAVLAITCNIAYSGSAANFNPRKKQSDTAICLEVKGKLPKSIHGAGTTYTVELIEGNTVIETKTIKGGSSFKFLFKRNECYGIRISEEGCTSKLINVFTEIPGGEVRNCFYKLSFAAENLLNETESKELNRDVLDFPIAIFEFDKKSKDFNYNKEYTAHIQKKLFEPLNSNDPIILPSR